jgi:hypothetical protein
MPTDDRRTLKAASSGNQFTSRTTGPFSAGPLYWSAGAARIPTFSHVLIAGAEYHGKETKHTNNRRCFWVLPCHATGIAAARAGDLNRSRTADVWGGTAVLAEIFMLGLEAAAPVAKEAANSSRLIRIL